jgi:hypothetical protein
MYRTLVIAAILWVGSAGWVLAADTPGSSDHPFIPRYPGSEIVSYEQEAFNEYGLLTGPVKFQEAEPREKIEGKITYITYDLKADRSSLEVMRNYEKALEENGFEFLYQCKNQDCGGRHFNHAAVEYNLRFGDHYSDQRYLAGKLSRPKEGDCCPSAEVGPIVRMK